MANLRLIKIVSSGNGAAFQPNPAGVQAGDRVHWNNETDEAHWLEKNSGEFLTNNIPAGEVSNPGFVANGAISYRCRLHPQEQGTISIVPAVVVAAVAAPAVAVPAVAPFAPTAARAFRSNRLAARKPKARKPTSRKKKKSRGKKRG